MTTSEGIRATLSWLATYGLHSTLFLGAAWLLCRLRPPRANRNRERVWKLALVGGVLSASLQLAVGLRPLLGRIDWTPLASTESRPEEVRTTAASAPAGAMSLAPPVARTQAATARREASARSSERPVLGAARTAEVHTVPAAREPEAPRTQAVELVAENAHERARPAQSVRELSAESAPASPVAGVVGGLETAFEQTAKLLSPRWPVLVLLGWSAVGLAGLLGLAASWTCLRRRMLGREILRDGPLLARLDELRARAGLRRRVRLSVSARIRAPFSTGLFRPEVCVPSAVLTDLSRAQQEALLAHELAHLVRRDPAWFGLGFLFETLFFFQPLNRIARRELAELAELSCDDWAVRWTGARLALASCLTEVAGWVVGEPRRRLAQPGLAGQRSRLGQRVTRLLDDRRSPAGEPPTPWWPPLAGGALVLVVLAVPGVSAVREHRPVPAPVASALPTPARQPRIQPPIQPPALARTEAEAAPVLPVANALTLESERGALESELALLESELAGLRAELALRALDTRFAEALARIDARMSELRAQHAAVGALVARLTPPQTPAPAPAPADAEPFPAERPGDSR